AERVEVVTRSPLEGALRWMSRGGKGYTVEDAERDAVGTTVYLHLRSDHRRYLDPERLRGIIRAYADLIGLPIFVGDDDKPANAVHGPWHRDYASDKERHNAYHDYWEGRFKDEVSLTVMPVDTRFEYPDDTEGVGTGALQGVLGITDRHVPGVDTRGTVDVYVSRMFVSRGNREVLPPWARFIQGVIESSDLTPNAARDNVVRNAALIAAQERL
ncbi:MAG: hypothetical protein GY856_30620, partial [bacterium]|nr:hypothetical protein [bacterium]